MRETLASLFAELQLISLPQGALDQLVERGRANGVRLEVVDEAGLRNIEPLAHTVGRAIWSPDTAVADPDEVMTALRG